MSASEREVKPKEIGIQSELTGHILVDENGNRLGDKELFAVVNRHNGYEKALSQARADFRRAKEG